MPTPADPREILQRLRPSLATLEAERRALLAKRQQGGLWIASIIAVGILLALFLASTQSIAPIIVLFATLVGVVICHVIFFASSKKSFHVRFKEEVVSQVCQSLAPEISFHPSHHVSEEWFQQSGLFTRPDRYNGEDFFSGKIGKTDLFFSEIHAEQRHTSTDSKGHSQTSYSTIFRGIFLVADFNKEFPFLRPSHPRRA